MALYRADAEGWIEEQIRRRTEQPKETTFAIRRSDGTLVGVVGADDLDVGASHRARIGYWLAKPYWNRGIMTDAVSRYVDYAFAELAVVRLTAEVFARDEASARVLQKSVLPRRAGSDATARRTATGWTCSTLACYGQTSRTISDCPPPSLVAPTSPTFTSL